MDFFFLVNTITGLVRLRLRLFVVINLLQQAGEEEAATEEDA